MFGSLCKLQGKLDLLIAQVQCYTVLYESLSSKQLSSQSEDNGLLAARQFLNTPLLTITAGGMYSDDIHVLG